MSEEKIVITGMGSLSSIGNNLTELKEALLSGKLGSKPATVFNTEGFDSVVNCEVKTFNPEQYIKYTPIESLGRTSQFSIAATKMALEDAGLTSTALKGQRIPVSIGTTDGESQHLDALAKVWVTKGLSELDGELVEQSTASNLANSISKEFGLTGESITVSTACSAGNYAIGHAFDLLKTGAANIAICGGADAVCRKTYSGFHRLGTIAKDKCQPFDLHRNGIMTGEGAGILILETLSSALKRKAHIYAEVLGYGLNCDAHHMVSPNMESVARCIRLAHDNANISPEDVDYICAHGTGTIANDTTESGAIRMVYGETPPPVSSIKSMLGHTMGAASAIASIACVLAIENQFLPPTINHEVDDPACNIDCVPNKSRPAKVNIVQNNGFAFGGNNAITIYGAYQQREKVS